MPKVTIVTSRIKQHALSASEVRQLDEWTSPVIEARRRYRRVFAEDDSRPRRLELPPRFHMKETTKLVYLTLRGLLAKTPTRFGRYETARQLGISPEALNAELSRLEATGFIFITSEEKAAVIEVGPVPAAPKAYVKRDFRGNNGYLNQFEGVMVVRLSSTSGVSFSERLDSWAWWINLSDTDEEDRAIETRLKPHVTSQTQRHRLRRLYWALFLRTLMNEDMQELDRGLLIGELYGTKFELQRMFGVPKTRGIFHSPQALRDAFKALERAGLIYCHYPAMAIALFPPCDEPPGTADWKEQCVRMIDKWLLERGLANRVATRVDHYRRTLKFWGMSMSYEPGLWEAAKDLEYCRILTGEYSVDELLEFFIEFLTCDGCDHEPHLAVTEHIPPTLAGFRDHVYLVYEQVLRECELVGGSGAILRRRTRGDVPEEQRHLRSSGPGLITVADVRSASVEWSNYLKQRRQTADG